MKSQPKQLRQCGFEADYKYISSKPDSSHIGKLYVDRFGREREETYIEHKPGWELTFIDIWDVVALKEYTLSAQNKMIIHQGSLDIETFSRDLNVGIPGILGYLLPRHRPCEGRDLGTKQIENLACKGSGRDFSGYKEIPSGVVECWYSDIIAYLVFVKATFDDIENTFQLYNIRLTEPNESLFVVPTDYTQANISYNEYCFRRTDDNPS